MATTFELIAAYTATGTVSTIDFSSIPATYTDLCVKVSARSSDATFVVGLYPEFNGDTTSGNYTNRRLYGTGTGPQSDTNRNVVFITGATATSNTFGNGEIYIPNYTGSTAKSFSSDSVEENNATDSYAGLGASLWSGTSAINRVTLKLSSGSFVTNSTAYLYGVKNA